MNWYKQGTFFDKDKPVYGAIDPYFGLPHHLKTDDEIRAWNEKRISGIVLIMASVINAWI